MRMIVREGQDAIFSCTVTGHPTPTIMWHVNGLLKSDMVTLGADKNESILILRNVSRSDAGRVDCSASNTLSTVNRQFFLYVKYKPVVTVVSPLLHYHLYDTATITCQVCSIPLSTVFDIFHPKQSTPLTDGIKEKNEQLLNQTCRQLTVLIYLNDSSLFAPYVCRARNSLGISHAEFMIKEIIPSTKRVKYVTERRHSVTLSTIINSSPASTFTTDNMNESSKRDIQSNVLIHEKNQSQKLTISFLLSLILFFIMF